MKIKEKKILVIALCMLLSVQFLFIKPSYADEDDKQIAETISALIPDTVEINISEIDGADGTIRANKVKEEIHKVFQENNVDEDLVEFSAFSMIDLHQVHTRVKKGQSYKDKYVNVKYSNSDNYNEEDEQYVKNITKDIKYVDLKEPIVIGIEHENEFLNKGGAYQTVLKAYEDAFDEMMKSYDVEVKYSISHGFYLCCLIYKDGICYKITDGFVINWIPGIIIPDDVEDTDEAYMDYAKPLIAQNLNWDMDDFDLEKNTNQMIVDQEAIDEEGATPIENDGTFYLATHHSGNGMRDIKIYKEAKGPSEIELDDNETGIELNTNTDVIPANSTLECTEIKGGEEYQNIKNTLGNGISKFKAFDINILKNGVKIQPDGKVKIRIPIPSSYNKSRIFVAFVDDNENVIKLNHQVIDNYAVFETEHFSNYVLAETDTSESDSNIDDNQIEEDEKKVDIDSSNESIEDNKGNVNRSNPKTGDNVLAYIATISLGLASIIVISIKKSKIRR